MERKNVKKVTVVTQVPARLREELKVGVTFVMSDRAPQDDKELKALVSANANTRKGRGSSRQRPFRRPLVSRAMSG